MDTDRPPEGSTLDRRTLGRTLLVRQLLLERVDAEPLAVIEQLVGVQAQVPLDPYVGLWARLRRFEPGALAQPLLERRAVRMTLMRSTLHLVSSADALRLRPVLQDMLERAFRSSPFARRLGGVDLAHVVERGAELLEGEPATLAELRVALSAEWPDGDADALAHAVRYLVPLVQITPRGVWGRRLQPTFTTLAAWLPGHPPVEAATIDELVIRYLRAFGPASTSDVRTWSWLADVRSVVERLRPQLVVYRDDAGRELYDVPDGAFCDGSTPAPVRFLPEYDNVFLSHADRSRIMDSVPWDASFAHRGSFLVDGFLAGAWKVREQKGDATLAVDLRRRVTAAERREVKEEAEQLLEFLRPEARSRRLTIEFA